jgi:hypothetical protein
MIFFYKLYYNPNYTNLNKKSPSDICLKPIKNTKYTIWIMQNKKIKENIGKQFKPKFNSFKLQRFFDWKKP